jgi:hypothetical protein
MVDEAGDYRFRSGSFWCWEGEAFEVRTCDKKESVNCKCEKRLGMRTGEIMKEGGEELLGEEA